MISGPLLIVQLFDFGRNSYEQHIIIKLITIIQTPFPQPSNSHQLITIIETLGNTWKHSSWKHSSCKHPSWEHMETLNVKTLIVETLIMETLIRRFFEGIWFLGFSEGTYRIFWLIVCCLFFGFCFVLLGWKQYNPHKNV